jgi:Protein of unknown function (DUF2914)/Tetratricopeptide repeat
MTVYNGPVAMPNVHDFRAIVQGVEQAEARGDHVTAERLLRQALTLQEASVGPNHPDVANILNNLAIVCELNGKLTDAEGSYRRAYAIATSSLPATDPFVTTSRENLEQFCSARGIPLKDTPPAASSVPRPAASSAPLPAASSAPPPRPAPPPPAPPKPVAKKAAAPKAAPPPPPRAAAPPSLDDFPLRSSSAVPASPRTLSAPAATAEPSRAPVIAAVLAVLVLLLVGGWYWFGLKPSRERTASAPPPSTTGAPPPATAAPPPAPSALPAEPAPKPQPAAPETAAAAPTPVPEPVAPPRSVAPEPVAPERPAATTAKSSTTVLTAEVCRTLTRTGAWTCAPATGAQDPGVMYFYTRVASPRDTTIEHRWYRDDRLYQRVPLRIRANPSGFRTYSQTRISADRAGKWKVELRSQDGQLLDEKTFAVASP